MKAEQRGLETARLAVLFLFLLFFLADIGNVSACRKRFGTG
jgi:hypothetical protein